MKKKYLTIDDLYNFFNEQNKDFVFSVKDKDTQYIVVANATITFDENSDGDLLPVHLQACHTGENVNKCNISDEDMNAALPSLINKPILGFIYKDDDGEYQFRSHDMHKEDGEIVYDEIIVGYLPESCNPQIKFDEEKKKNFVEVDGYIVEKYTKAADILRREGKCQVSVEMAVNEMNYNAQTRILNITDFIFTGVTILGRFEDGTEVQAGMAGSNITIRDSEVAFSDTQIKLEELSRQVAEIQQSLSIKNSEKGGTESLMKFDELLAKYNKTAEEVTFETEGLSDEELEAKFAEVFGETPIEGDGGEQAFEEGEQSGENPEEGEEAGTPAPEEGGESNTDNSAGEVGEPAPEAPVAEVTASIKVGDKVTTFGLSLDEKYRALHDLVNVTYGEADNDYYSVDVYEDDNYVIMQSWCTNHAYKQSIAREGDNYSLVGERVEVFSIWVTEEEKNSIDSMRNSYDSMLAKLQNYETEPDKMEVLNREDYDGVRESEEFSKLAEIETHFEMSVDEVKTKADTILLEAARNNSIKFAAQNVQTTRKPIMFKATKSTGRYGNMFSDK